MISAWVLALALAAALCMRPWRLLARQELLTPLLAALVITPWIWALPWLHHMPLQLQLSGACLIVLTLGWPLAVPVFCLAGAAVALLTPVGWQQAAQMSVWLGLAPASFSVLLGAALRRWAWRQVFVYILGRAFLGTALCLFLAGALAQALGERTLAAHVEPQLALIARWLLAWGDAFMTGMLTAIFVAFRPQWLATWSDRLYLAR